LPPRASRLAPPEDDEPFLRRDEDEERYADEFVEEQEADAEERRPLEADGETAAPYRRDAAVFAGAEEPRAYGSAAYEPPRRSGVRPFALGAILGLLVGFAAGAVFMIGRGEPVAQQTQATAAPSTSTAAPGTTPPANPRDFSDQAVTPNTPPSAQPSAAQPPADTPPTVAETGEPAPSGDRAEPPSAAAAAPARRGTITVRSTPPRAGVTVNNAWRGRTPLTLDSLPFGRYTIRIVQPGFAVAREEVVLSASDASRSVNVRLEPEAAAPPSRPSRSRAPAAAPAPVSFSGSLFVDSRPQGATVLLDGKAVGKTPLRLGSIPIGTHVVRLELAGHRSWTSTARIVANEEKRVTGSLEETR
jgi:hypothetical protein